MKYLKYGLMGALGGAILYFLMFLMFSFAMWEWSIGDFGSMRSLILIGFIGGVLIAWEDDNT